MLESVILLTPIDTAFTGKVNSSTTDIYSFLKCKNQQVFFYSFSAVCVLVIACRRVSMFCKMKYSIFFSAVSQNAMVVRRRVFFSYRMPPCVNICQNVKFNKFVINLCGVCISVTVCRFCHMPKMKSTQDLSLPCVL